MKPISVTRHGIPLYGKPYYIIDEEKSEFSTNLADLVIDASEYRGWNFIIGNNSHIITHHSCMFKAGYDCTFRATYNCVFKTGDNCMFCVGNNCTFNTAANCMFNTGYQCSFKTGAYCTFKCGDDCYFTTGSSCTFTTVSNCTFTTGMCCTFRVDENCKFKITHGCTFNVIDVLTQTFVCADGHSTILDRNDNRRYVLTGEFLRLMKVRKG